MSISPLRTLLARLPRHLCTTATATTTTTATPYKTPGPPVTRRPRKQHFNTGPYELPGEPRPTYPKRRNPYKRTTALIKALNKEEALRLIHQGRAVFARKIPNPHSGDLIRVTYVSTLEDKRVPHCFLGICIAVRRAGVGSTVVLRNVVDGVPVERGFPIYSPLIRDAEIVGKRKVRKAKLYYLRDRPLRESTFLDAIKRPPGLTAS